MVRLMDGFANMNFQLPSIFQQHAGYNASASNGTVPDSTGDPSASFPAGAMDSFLLTAGQASPLMQLVLFVYRMLGSQLGLDPSLVLTLLGFVWGFSKIGSQIYNHTSDFIERHFMCVMYVSEYDHMYRHILKWLAQQQSIRNSRYLMAETVWKSAWDGEEELAAAVFFTDGGDGDGDHKYLNFSNQAAKSSPRFVPAMGLPQVADEARTEPIKRLLEEAKQLYYHDTHQKTAIYRPKIKERRRDYSMWQQAARRPVRPMRTVVLDDQEKHSILADLNEYLHPATPKWYASRGIPLRRGYLFHGPPGTGKTSFSFALAGVFGIDIYVISLQDVNVTEEDLALLFTELPRRCIVLLEDIDTAGLRRDNEDDGKETDDKKAEEKKAEEKKAEEKRADENKADENKSDEKKSDREEGEAQTNGVTDAKNDESKPVTNGTTDRSTEEEKKKTKKNKEEEKANSHEDSSDASDSDDSSEDDRRTRQRQMRRRRAANKKKSGSGKKLLPADNISLSGLLNAIDGVASHEGRVLIMTTNKPESLDEALIRPGRVDVQVAFKNASSKQAKELFCRMYEEAAPPKPRKDAGSSDSNKAAKDEKTDKVAKMLTRHGQKIDVTAEEVNSISKTFGERIPEGMFSPAEIQGFLLKRKTDPRKALEEMGSWVEGLIKQKETNSKVVTVQ
ncbi:hypothetical protein QQS21_002707 [Conoideocrella luteorostrata]|uniref:P-loop containing nucleoside triphosphate hydrolase protein n=1 Tax=Conoideocrella luteorostrata TaxID=1105319 RepID=A0AAJ0FX05_9HYPO|nr:hypothetical protein QQS21_002707 [Conoideocrella luteorostrata]